MYAERIFTAVKHDRFLDTMQTAWHTAAGKAARETEASPDAAAISDLYENLARNTLRKHPQVPAFPPNAGCAFLLFLGLGWFLRGHNRSMP